MSNSTVEAIIKLPYVSSVKDFVNIAMRYKCTATMVSNAYTVDAKSIMGLLSLDLSKPVKLILERNGNGSDDRKDFMAEISEYVVA